MDKVATEVDSFKGAAASSAVLTAFIADPTVSRVKKTKGIFDVMDSMKVSPVTKNFFGVVAENGRMSDVFKIVDDFQKLVDAHKGEARALVTVAKPLSDANTVDLKNSIGSWLEHGQKLTLEVKVDPSIQGGMIVEMGEKFVDLSVASRLKKMEALLTESL